VNAASLSSPIAARSPISPALRGGSLLAMAASTAAIRAARSAGAGRARASPGPGAGPGAARACTAPTSATSSASAAGGVTATTIAEQQRPQILGERSARRPGRVRAVSAAAPLLAQQRAPRLRDAQLVARALA
jgi:hypothetical protein